MRTQTRLEDCAYAIFCLNRTASPYHMLVSRLRIIDDSMHEMPDIDRVIDNAAYMIDDLVGLAVMHTYTYMRLNSLVEARLISAACVRNRSFATHPLDVLRLNVVAKCS